MATVELLRWLHVIGAAVLLGTGAGIAFFMVMAHRTGDATFIACTARTVILADWLFTLSAVLAQPATGYLLAQQIGWPLSEGWIASSLTLYVMVGLFWLPVVWMQHRMHRLAAEAARKGSDLPAAYHRMFRLWFLCGIPAFVGVLAIFWLMLNKPGL
jgi:uncharacterized membrane protein